MREKSSATHRVRCCLGNGLELAEIDLGLLTAAISEGAILDELTPYVAPGADEHNDI